MTRLGGIDISATTAHVVVMDAAAQILEAGLWATADLGRLADDLAGCDVVAIDSPDRWSAGPIPEHANLSPKFIAARCAEWELARKYRYWVPWVTPVAPQTPDEHARYAWIERGIELFERLAGRNRDRGLSQLDLPPTSRGDEAARRSRRWPGWRSASNCSGSQGSRRHIWVCGLTTALMRRQPRSSLCILAGEKPRPCPVAMTGRRCGFRKHQPTR
jgi:hypothetical protein